MRMMSIASGSSGNCIYIGSEDTHILIDAGISRKRIVDGLKKVDLELSDISAIFVTHEHIDHIKGIGVISRKEETPIYATEGTIQGIKDTSSLGLVTEEVYNTVNADKELHINDLCIHPFTISHDANEPVAYTVTCGKEKMSVITDLGKYDDYIVDNLKGTNSLLIEANHDIKMLQVGSYPYYLKQRILGDKGHLSNETSGRLLSDLLCDDLKNVMLGHLSKENNYEQLAYETVRLEIDLGDNGYKASDFCISVAPRDVPSAIFEL